MTGFPVPDKIWQFAHGGPLPLVAVEWEDTTNVAGWQSLAAVADWATDGSWHVTNVGYLVHEDDDCLVVAARLAFDADPPQAGAWLSGSPKRSIRAFHRLDGVPAQQAAP
ncbi:MAG: hypothetical protein JO222_03980 [Frankiales bacterium]|nr:hypothetical protein [Frankiales bacterium]